MKKRKARQSKLASFRDDIISLLDRHEQEYIPATVIYEKLVEKGYDGSLSLLQKWIRKYRRSRLPKAVIRYETPPGQQAQVDWGEKRIKDSPTVYIFCMILSYSRMRFVHFFPKADMYSFLLGHKLAFSYFGGTPGEILYDQNRCVVKKPGFVDVVFNEKLLDFARHYGFIPRVCRPYRAQTKGKVENTVKYVKQNFLSIQPRYQINILNQRKRAWLEKVNHRVHSTTREIPLRRLCKEELRLIDTLPDYNLFYLETRKVFNDSTFSFHSQRFSVPPIYVGKYVTIKYRPERHRINVYFQEKPITQHHTDTKDAYVIKRAHRWSIWRLWREEKHLFYQKAKQQVKATNHPLAIYEAISEGEAAVPENGRE